MVDALVITKRLNKLREYIGFLKEIRLKSREQFVTDPFVYGTICAHRTNTTFIAFCLFESQRNMGETAIRSTLCEQAHPREISFTISRGDGENSETDSSLDFAKDCGYITVEQHANLTALCREVGKMLGSMMNKPTSFLIQNEPG